MLIAPDRLWTGGRLCAGMAVEVARGTVAAVRPLGGDTPDLTPHLLIPGPTDLQVNGGGGALFNADPTPATLETIVAAHRRLGTGEILATLITDTPGVMEAAVDAAIAARDMPGLLGLHLEGPHIAAARRGTHAAAHIRPLDARTVAQVTRARRAGLPVMVTLAPEETGAAVLSDLLATGAIVSAGHSAADAATARAAFAAGITCVTHLFNAMAPMTSRAPNLLGAAILSDAHCGLIADGHHVSWEMIRLALSARPRPDRTFLVSDAMATVGGPDRLTLYGQKIRLDRGRLINAEVNLAGAHLDMATALGNLHRMAGVPLATAVAMATDIPRRAVGLAPLDPAPGLPLARLTALDAGLRPVALA